MCGFLIVKYSSRCDCRLVNGRKVYFVQIFRGKAKKSKYCPSAQHYGLLLYPATWSLRGSGSRSHYTPWAVESDFYMWYHCVSSLP